MAEPDIPGVVVLFTGDGKGKTTAAVGTAVRAAGHGLRVALIFFMKNNSIDSGEVAALSRIPNIAVFKHGCGGWVTKDNICQEDVDKTTGGLKLAQQVVGGNEYNLVILDEINTAIDLGLAEKEKLLEIIKGRPTNVSLILTGRNACAELVALADVATEMLMIKHHYEKGITARKGLDY